VEWVAGGKTDKRYGSIFDMREEYFLLGAIESMEFIHKKQGRLSRVGQTISSAGNYLLDSGDI